MYFDPGVSFDWSGNYMHFVSQITLKRAVPVVLQEESVILVVVIGVATVGLLSDEEPTAAVAEPPTQHSSSPSTSPPSGIHFPSKNAVVCFTGPSHLISLAKVR